MGFNMGWADIQGKALLPFKSHFLIDLGSEFIGPGVVCKMGVLALLGSKTDFWLRSDRNEAYTNYPIIFGQTRARNWFKTPKVLKPPFCILLPGTSHVSFPPKRTILVRKNQDRKRGRSGLRHHSVINGIPPVLSG